MTIDSFWRIFSLEFVVYVRPIIHTFGTWKMPSNAEDAHMCLYTLRLKTWAIEPKEFWTLLQQLLGVSTLLRPSVFFAFYDGGEWEMVGRACTCMCVITQTSIYYIIQCRERQPLKTQNYFVWGYFLKKKGQNALFFLCLLWNGSWWGQLHTFKQWSEVVWEL